LAGLNSPDDCEKPRTSAQYQLAIHTSGLLEPLAEKIADSLLNPPEANKVKKLACRRNRFRYRMLGFPELDFLEQQSWRESAK
jgi:hypothetical protein